MSGRKREEKSGTRGGTAWNDGLYSIDGGGAGNVSSNETSSSKTAVKSWTDFFGPEVAPWFDPIEEQGGIVYKAPNQLNFDLPTEDKPKEMTECKDGVCPVPWATDNIVPVPPAIQSDTVNHPEHYTDGGIECIEAIEAQLTPEEYRGALKMAIIKYIWRERLKGGTESLKKASWYLERLIAFDEAQNG